MKNFTIILLLLVLSTCLYPQDASLYFPSNTGFKWSYKNMPLDSVNKEIDSLTYYQVDSFTVANQNYKGKAADIIISKIGISNDIPYLPFFDTSYVAFEGSEAFSYFELFNIDSILNSLNSKIIRKPKKESKISGIASWFSLYRFAAAENQAYQIYSKDSTIFINNTNLPVRFAVSGKLFADQNIELDGMKFNCKKFAIDDVVSYLLGNFPIKIFAITDTVWIAQGQWIVQDIMPSTTIDLNIVSLGKIFIPGLKRTLVSQIPTAVKDARAKVNSFRLYQNYPNPFNPGTKIKYSLEEGANIELTVYDLLGKKVATLVDKQQNAGNYEVEFNPSLIWGGISAGVYFYKLKTGSTFIVKKLLYLK
jgi:Secretion system C-terminal sorting domain